MSKRHLWVLLLFLFFFATHLLFFYFIWLPSRELREDANATTEFGVKIGGDEVQFAHIAHNLYTQGLYSIDGEHPTARRMPLFPLVLWGIFHFTHNLMYGILLNCLIAALMALAAYKLASLYWSFNTSLAAMIAVGFSPHTYQAPGNLVASPLYALLVIVSLLCFSLLSSTLKLRHAVLCGLVTGLAALARAEGSLLIVIYLSYLLYRRIFRRQKTLYLAAIFLVIAASFPAVWVARNYFSMHFLGLSTMSGVVFAGAHNRRILDRHPGSWGNIPTYFSPAEMEALKGMNEVEANNYLWQRGLNTMKEYNPFYLVWVEIKKLFNTFKPSFRILPKDYSNILNAVLVAPYFFLYGIFLLTLFGFIKTENIHILFLPLITSVVVPLIFWGGLRWRIHYEPIIFTIAVGALSSFLSRRRIPLGLRRESATA